MTHERKVPIGISCQTCASVRTGFGGTVWQGASSHPYKPLSQPGQFASAECGYHHLQGHAPGRADPGAGAKGNPGGDIKDGLPPWALMPTGVRASGDIEGRQGAILRGRKVSRRFQKG